MFKKQGFFNKPSNNIKLNDSISSKFEELELSEVDITLNKIEYPSFKKPQLKEEKPIFIILTSLSSQKEVRVASNIQCDPPKNVLFPDNCKPNVKSEMKASNILSKYIQPYNIEYLRKWAKYSCKNEAFNFEKIVENYAVKPEIKKLLPNKYCLGTDIVPSYLSKKTKTSKAKKDIKPEISFKSVLKAFNAFKGYLSNESNLAFIGYPKSGKSTILGNILLNLNAFNETFIKKTGWEATKMDSIHSKIAWLLDSSNDERIYKETILSSFHYVEINGKSFNLIDCPGNLCYYNPIIKAIMNADDVILTVNLINEWNNRTETFNDIDYIQFLFHLLKIFKVDTIKIVFINGCQIDSDVPLRKLQAIWKKFSKSKLTIIATINELANIQSGEIKSIIDHIGNWPIKTSSIAQDIEKPLLLEIIDIFKPIESNLPVIVGRVIRGGIFSGINNVSSKAVVCPENIPCTVKSLKINEKDELVTRLCAFPGHIVELTLPEITSEDSIRIGSFICHPEHPLTINKCFQVQLVIFDCDISVPIINGMNMFMWSRSRSCFCQLTHILSIEYYDRKEKIVKRFPRMITQSECVVNARISSEEFLAVEFHSNLKLDVFLLFSELKLFSAGKFINLAN